MNYTESTAIPWRTLHPWQRNQVIAEKIMGITEFRCTGKLDYRGNNTMLRHHYYRCLQCGATLTVTDAWPAGWKPSVHNKLTPHYSESMDAAWQLVEKLSACYDVVLEMDKDNTHHYEARCWARREGIESTRHSTDTSMIEAICIAALRAVGCEVEL